MNGRALVCFLLAFAFLIGGIVSTIPPSDGQIVSLILENVGPSRESEEFFSIKPAVQFSCARQATPFEDELEAKLAAGTDGERLDALRILVSKSCPSSVALQWKALSDLRRTPALRLQLRPIEEQFERDAVLAAINKELPSHWAIRAAGVLQIAEAVPRLTELALQSGSSTTSLAAERSLEDIPGEEATRSLEMVYTNWQYDSFIRAGRALIARDRARFGCLLEATEPPDRFAYRHALFLAAVDNPRAVPILCRTVQNVAIVDGQMFDEIRRLGLRSHQEVIEKLPAIVRPEQRDRATACVAAFREKLTEADR